MYEIFAQILKERSITPYRVSKDTGVSQATLSDWKRGRSVPKTDKLQLIADYLNVSVDNLLTGTDNKKSPTNAEDDVPEEFLVMARKAGDIPPEQRKRLYKFLDSTIDNFLEALKDEQSNK